MVFNFKLLFKLAFKSFFAAGGTNARLTPKRFMVLFLMLAIYLLIEIPNWIGFLLDEIFFSSYRKIDVKEPVFILGVPRGGTTFLHRLLAKDEEQFTYMAYWEIMFAPSITQKKIFMALGAIDQRLGGPMAKLISFLEKKMFGSLDHAHKLRLFEPEEDEVLLLHIFSTVFLMFAFPFDDEIRPLMFFDDAISPTVRRRIMRFYKQCVQRHLYVFGNGKRYLSKNPIFSPKVQSIGETFPDAKIICMLRTPLNVLPSLLSTHSPGYKILNSPIEPYPLRELTFSMLAHWYRYPVNQLKKWQPSRQAVVKYDDLIQNLNQTILSIYERFSFNISPGFHQILREETEKSKRYRSKHNYSLEQIGLTQEQVTSDYKDIFEEFGFDPLNSL